MKYGKIDPISIANGVGVRVAVFVSGCRNHCPGCFQPETWDFQYGQEFTNQTLLQVLRCLNHPYVKGLTILGGDPMEPENQTAVLALCKAAKLEHPEKDIWLYTGYLFEQFPKSPLWEVVDVVVDGRFVEAQKDLSLRFRGSRNQRIIDVQKSVLRGCTVLWEDPHSKGDLK